MFVNPKIQSTTLTLNTAGTVTAEFYFPNGARIVRYFAVPAVAQAAHASVVDTVTFTDRGTGGAGSTDLAILTNDSDLADSTTRKSAAWVAHDALEINAENRPGGADATNVADEIAVGGVVSVALLGAGATPTANFFTVGVQYRASD
jgi:hypothetical protein